MSQYQNIREQLKSAMSILEAIGFHCSDKLDRCNDQGCCVGLEGIKDRIIIKGEQLTLQAFGKEKKSCDCFIFTINEMLVVSLVELKSQTPKFDDLQEKFDNSVTATELILRNHKNYWVVPILLARSFSSKPSNNPTARRLTVKIRGRNKPIVYGKCGKQLIDIITRQSAKAAAKKQSSRRFAF